MRRTLSSLVALVFVARFVAIAAAADYTLLGYDDRMPPPPPPASCTEHSDCEATGCAPVILQVGSPPVIYSPADDFIAHARAALGAASTDDHYAPATIYPTVAASGSPAACYPIPPLPFTAPALNSSCVPPANVIYGPWIPAPYQPALACVEPMCAAYADPATGLAAISADRLDHLLQAVDHLDAAGLHGEADQVRRVCTSDMRTVLSKYKADQSELAALRQQKQHEADDESVLVPSTRGLSQIFAGDHEEQHEVAPAACTPGKCDSSGSKSVAVSVQFIEINCTKLRNLGFDFGVVDHGTCTPGSLAETIQASAGQNGFLQFLEALNREGVAEVISAPKMIARSGEQAFVQIGQQVPFPVLQGQDKVSIEYKHVGTELNVKPVVLDGNKLRIQVRSRISEIDHAAHPATVGGMTVPGLKERDIETIVGLESGQSAVIHGMVEKREAHQVANKKSDLAGFVQKASKEEHAELQDIELVIVMRADIVDEAKRDEQCDSASCENCQCGKCQCTHSECTQACNGRTALVNPFAVEPAGYCSCGDAFGVSSCSDLFKLEPMALEPGKFLTPTITPQPYEIDPATFLKQCEHPQAEGSFFGRFSR
jgi:hypothetical protein